ncbi:MAG: DUF58 domain-containing protein [Planctomycetota bacterium]|nr:DUF58 domain-containing protein [Planctomycetota bacterium]
MTPRPKLLVLFALGGVLFAAGIFAPELASLGLVANLVLVAIAVADLLLTPSTRQIELERETSEVLSVGTENPVSLRAVNRSQHHLEVELTDEPPRPSRTEGLPLRMELTPWKARSASYRLVPRRRGQNRFDAVHLRFASRLGLWTLMERRPLPLPVKIYPDISAVRRYDLLAVRNRLEEVGLKLFRIRGQGGEFERLREYRREDAIRHVDWKATAKYQRLISREYNVERNQNIVLLLDCGRSMRNETDGVSHLDRGLNATTILSYIALAQGDNVSLLAFSNRIERFVGPLRGKPAIQTIVRQMYDLEARWDVSDYGGACDELLRRQRKRALVILLTHTLDEQHLDSIGRYLRSLTHPHLMLCVFLRDLALWEMARRVPESDVEAYQIAAAAELLTVQARRFAELRDSGVLVLDALPSELSAVLVNQYIDLKARHLL